MNKKVPGDSPANSNFAVQVKGHQIDVGDALRTHVQDSLSAMVTKYFDNALEASAVFSREGNMFRVDLQVHAARGITLQANGSAADPYPAYDDASGRMATQLSRHKKKLISQHHHQQGSPKSAWLDSSEEN